MPEGDEALVRGCVRRHCRVQASARLGFNKMFQGSNQQRPQQYNPNGNNGQYGAAYANAKAAESKEIPVIEQKYDKNGNPLPLQYPEGWWQPLYADLPFFVPESNFDYAAEHDSQDFFRNFFEDNRNIESAKTLEDDTQTPDQN